MSDSDAKTPEEPSRQWTKVVTVLDCVPARADTPGTGEKVVLLTVEHKGEVEQTMLLSLEDGQKLLVSLLAVLAYHGDEQCKKIVDQYFSDDEDDE